MRVPYLEMLVMVLFSRKQNGFVPPKDTYKSWDDFLFNCPHALQNFKICKWDKLVTKI